MWTADKWSEYELLDCGGGERLERWGPYTLVRPDPQAIWSPPRRNPLWKRADARYARSSTGGGAWEKNSLPGRWQIAYGDLTWNIKPMNFKHTGLFPGRRSPGRGVRSRCSTCSPTPGEPPWPAPPPGRRSAMWTPPGAW